MKKFSLEWEGDTPPEVGRLLERFTVPPPSPGVREAAVAAALREMDRKASARWTLLRQMGIEARFLPLWYYGASLLIAITGAGLLRACPDQTRQIGLLAGMTPLPLLLGLVELFHGADEGMAEVEAACRYTPARVLSARMLLIGGLSCVSALLLGLCAGHLSLVMTAGLVVVPFCLSAASGLMLSVWLQSRISSAQVAVVVAFVNTVLAKMISSDWMGWTGRMDFIDWIFMMAVSVFLLAASVMKLLRVSGTLYERMVLE